MGPSNTTPREESGRSGAVCRQPCCPLCNGPLVPLRGDYRCSRCLFHLCVGCEAPEVPGGLDRGD
jgi:hypothetical protein